MKFVIEMEVNNAAFDMEGTQYSSIGHEVRQILFKIMNKCSYNSVPEGKVLDSLGNTIGFTKLTKIVQLEHHLESNLKPPEVTQTLKE